MPHFPADRFSQYREAILWAQASRGPGRVALSHETALVVYGISDANPARVHLTVPKAARFRREKPKGVALHSADLGEGDGYAFVVRPGAGAQQQWHRVMRCDGLLQGRAPQRTVAALPANRVAIAHMRSLQALDGLLAGASQREIAGVLFGKSRVERNWHADGELRAQIRYLIRRGEALMQGGYADLVTSPAHASVRTAARHDGGGR